MTTAARRKRTAKDPAWDGADWRYSALVAETSVPFFGRRISAEDEMHRLEDIVRDCPALYHLGGRKVASGKEAEGRSLLLAAADRMAKRERVGEAEPEKMSHVLEFLEENLRYDVARALLERLVRHYPSQAYFYDELGAAALILGGVDAATASFNKAVELEPRNAHYLSNLGWAHLVTGRLDKAQEFLDRALAIKPSNEATQGNYEILRYLKRTGGTFMDYLLRPLDRKGLERLEKRCDRDGAFQDLDREAAQWNGDRLEAWKWELCRGRDLADYSQAYKSLRAFFRFIGGLSEDMYTLYEDMALLESRFGRIMNKFIFKMGDADAEVIDEIYAGLLSFYGFLAQRGLLDQKDYAKFRSELLRQKPAILRKTRRYGAVRHNDSIPENEKERVRQELFEGDHSWPGI